MASVPENQILPPSYQGQGERDNPMMRPYVPPPPTAVVQSNPTLLELNMIRREMQETKTLLKMVLLSAGGSLPTTAIGSTFTGNQIDVSPTYVELYKNNLNRLLAVKVVADFVVPGATISISLTKDQSRNGEVDVLASTGKVISETLWIKPDYSLYIANRDTTFSLNGSTFRVLLFDPLSFSSVLGSGV
jgi:hypothetical protein